MRYLVTGAAGFIGAHLVKALLDRGHTVHGVDNFITGYRDRIHPNMTFHEIDLRNRENVYELLTLGFDGVFHLAAVPRVPRSIEDPVGTHENNADATFNVFEAARQAKTSRVVFASSSTVYGTQDSLPLHEGMKPNPICPYGAQKLLGEEYAKIYSLLYGVQTVSLRFFSVYGLGMNLEEKHALAIPAFLKARIDNRPLTIFGTGEYTRDCTHVRDVVDALVRAMEYTGVWKGEVINIGAGHNVTINYLAKLIGGTVEYHQARTEVANTHADNARARSILKWEPTVSIEAGITELKQHYGIT